MIMYVKNPIKKSITLLEKRRKIYKDGYIEQVNVEYEIINFTMLYLHPNLASKNEETLKQIFEDVSESTGRFFLYRDNLIVT